MKKIHQIFRRMKRFTYRSDNRLCVHFRTLTPSLNFSSIENYLKDKGYTINTPNIIEVAKAQIGKKYKRGSKINEGTFDCSLFTQYVYGQMGIYLPRISIDQFDSGIQAEEDPVPGDLIFTSGKNGYFHESNPEVKIGHVGLYTGSSVIHAANTERGVVEDSWEIFFGKEIPLTPRVVRIHPYLNEAITLILPPNSDIDSDSHLRWRLLAALG